MPENTAPGVRNDPYRKFQFQVYSIGGCEPIPRAAQVGFSDVSGLRSDTEIVEYKEGDRRFTRKLPGKTSFDNVVLSRGVDRNGHLVAWRNRVIERGGTAAPDDNLRTTLIIDMYDRRGITGNPIRTWRIEECWPAVLEYDDLSGGSSDVQIERLELANEGQVVLTW